MRGSLSIHIKKEESMAAIRKTTRQQREEFFWGWLFILPTMIGLTVLNIIPIFQTIYQSFFKTGDFGRGNIFVGLSNYQRLLADADVWQALINTLKYAVVEVVFSRLSSGISSPSQTGPQIRIGARPRSGQSLKTGHPTSSRRLNTWSRITTSRFESASSQT